MLNSKATVFFGLISFFYFTSFTSIPTFASIDAHDEEKIRAIVMEVAGFKDEILPVGTIIPYAGNGGVPNGFIECDGRSLPKQGLGPNGEDFQALYAIIGDAYTPAEKKNESTFQLPDLRGRVAMGAGQGAELSHRPLGTPLGTETHQLTVSEMPQHSHDVNDPKHDHGVVDKGHMHSTRTVVAAPGTFHIMVEEGGPAAIRGNLDSASSISTSNVSVEKSSTHISVLDQGGSRPHNNIQPSLVVRYLIKWKGSHHFATSDNPAATR